MYLKDVMTFAEESLGHELGGPFWICQAVRFIQSCMFEWGVRKCADVSYWLDKES